MKIWAVVLLLVSLPLGLGACVDRETAPQRFAHMEQRAAGGDIQAWYLLGLMREQGYGAARDQLQAAFCYKKAAEKGHVPAQSRLGYLYFHGLGVPKDPHTAAAWYKKAAGQGDVEAQAALGDMYLLGEGVPQDVDTAAYWHKKSLNSEDYAGCARN